MDLKERNIKIKAMLKLGRSSQEIADKLGIKRQTVDNVKHKWKKEEAQAKANTITPEAVEVVLDHMKKEEAPAQVIAELETLHKGVTGLQSLDSEFQAVMLKAVKKAEFFLSAPDLEVKEWNTITNTLSNAYANIFNKSGVNVQVNNTQNISSESVNLMKGMLRG